jgi:hypothetical protein
LSTNPLWESALAGFLKSKAADAARLHKKSGSYSPSAALVALARRLFVFDGRPIGDDIPGEIVVDYAREWLESRDPREPSTQRLLLDAISPESRAAPKPKRRPTAPKVASWRDGSAVLANRFGGASIYVSRAVADRVAAGWRGRDPSRDFDLVELWSCGRFRYVVRVAERSPANA